MCVYHFYNFCFRWKDNLNLLVDTKDSMAIVILTWEASWQKLFRMYCQDFTHCDAMCENLTILQK